MRRYCLLLLFGILIVFALVTPASYAQPQPPEVVPLHTIADPQDSSLSLSVFFSLKDHNGDPVLKDNVGFDPDATAQLLDGSSQPVKAVVNDPNTPIKIALVIDNSGSMNQVIGKSNDQPVRTIDAVRAAARNAIASAPENASFAVFSFAQQFQPQSGGFLRKADQADLIRDAIAKFEAQPAGTGNTCLSDAADKAIDYLVSNVTDPVERKAIILFTDGKDKEGDNTAKAGNNCSNLNLDAIIRKAKLSSNTTIPIYTIAPCNETCDNIRRADLEGLARDTLAFPAIGQYQDISDLFKKIMDILNSQWVIQTNVFAHKGPNTATLRIKLRDGDTFLTTTSNFESPRDYNPPPKIEIANQKYLQDTDTFSVSLQVENPTQVEQITVGVFDRSDGGTQVSPKLQTFKNPAQTVDFALSTDGLSAGVSYFLQVTAINKAGAQIRNEKNSTILSVNQFDYKPKLNYEIISVDPLWDQEVLDIQADTQGIGGRTLTFKGVVTNKATGMSEQLQETPIRDGHLRPALPKIIREATQTTNYIVTLTLEDSSGTITKTYERTIEPRLAPSFFQRAISNPLVIGSVLVFFLAVLGIILYPRLRPRKRTIPAPRPQNEATILLPSKPREKTPPEKTLPEKMPPDDATVLHTPDPSAKPRVRLHVRVTQTPDQMQIHDRVFSAFPVVIGRSKGELIITGDPKISGAHMQISEAKDGFILTDLNSTNGTTVGDKKLEKGEKVTFSARTVVRLGPNTTIELEPKQ